MTKNDALSTVINCAKEYENNLNNKNFLFVCCDKKGNICWFEITFNASNFLHLTGLKKVNEANGSPISPKDFYKRCLYNKVSLKNFDLSADGTTEMKLRVLPALMKKDLSAKMVGDYAGTNLKLYTETLAGSVTGCMGFVKSNKNNKNFPNTVLNEDIRKIASPLYRILVTYRKPINNKYYSEEVYRCKDFDFSGLKLPDELNCLIINK